MGVSQTAALMTSQNKGDISQSELTKAQANLQTTLDDNTVMHHQILVCGSELKMVKEQVQVLATTQVCEFLYLCLCSCVVRVCVCAFVFGVCACMCVCV